MEGHRIIPMIALRRVCLNIKRALHGATLLCGVRVKFSLVFIWCASGLRKRWGLNLGGGKYLCMWHNVCVWCARYQGTQHKVYFILRLRWLRLYENKWIKLFGGRLRSIICSKSKPNGVNPTLSHDNLGAAGENVRVYTIKVNRKVLLWKGCIFGC